MDVGAVGAALEARGVASWELQVKGIKKAMGSDV
jgi:hypothetical protein